MPGQQAQSVVGAHLSFDDLLSPLDRQAFDTAYQGRRDWFHSGDPQRFDGLLSWSALNDLVRDQRPAGPRFRVMRDGTRLPETAYQRLVPTLRGPLRQIDVARLMAELRQDGTLVWDGLDRCHPPVRELKYEVERALGAFAFVNMYASWGNESGTNDHWDDHEIFALQLVGRKHWQSHPPTRRWPLPDDAVSGPPPAYTRDVTMAPGSLLYLPRGWWHRVTPVGEPSLHLSVGVLRPTNADLLGWLLENAHESELVRQDFPLGMDAAARSAHADALRAVVDAWLQPASLEQFAAVQEARHGLDPRPTLQVVGDRRPSSWDPDATAYLLSTRARVERRDGAVLLVVAGTEHVAPAGAAKALADLVGGRPLRLGELIDQLPEDLVAELVESGIVALA